MKDYPLDSNGLPVYEHPVTGNNLFNATRFVGDNFTCLGMWFNSDDRHSIEACRAMLNWSMNTAADRKTGRKELKEALSLAR